jgi:ribonuclease J
VLLPKSGQVMITDGARIIPGETLNLREIIVDGLGVGDVGNIVLAERKQMADEGMLVVVLPSLGAHFDASEIHLVSRGFVFMRESEELMDDLRLLIAETISNARKERKSDEIVRLIEKKVGEFCYKRLQRRPLVVVEGV